MRFTSLPIRSKPQGSARPAPAPNQYLSASLAANLLAYSREKGVWAKARSKARCQVPDGCWGLG